MDADMEAGRRNPVLMDASSAIILFKCLFFELVAEYFRLIMAESAYLEVTPEGCDGADMFCRYRMEESIKIQGLPGTIQHPGRQFQPVKGLGAGERDTILLYQAGIGDLVLLDDGKGALYCRNNDIPFVNSLLVPRVLHLGGLIDIEERDRAMKRIMAYGRYSYKIIEYAYGCGDEKLASFL